jgi:hypothetical protein
MDDYRRPAGTHPGLAALEASIEPIRRRVREHPVHRGLVDVETVRVFLAAHAYAVWDSMSLLASLQRWLTCVSVPWFPSGPTSSRRLISELVLVEESDESADGYLSHFELYREAMRRAGAPSASLNLFLDLLGDGLPVAEAVELSGAPYGAAGFVATTWEIIATAPVHCQAAAFVYGRAEPADGIAAHVARIADDAGRLEVFKQYLARHAQADGERHTPMATRMLVDLCGDDERAWQECAGTAQVALEARLGLWDAIAARFEEVRGTHDLTLSA